MKTKYKIWQVLAILLILTSACSSEEKTNQDQEVESNNPSPTLVSNIETETPEASTISESPKVTEVLEALTETNPSEVEETKGESITSETGQRIQMGDGNSTEQGSPQRSQESENSGTGKNEDLEQTDQKEDSPATQEASTQTNEEQASSELAGCTDIAAFYGDLTVPDDTKFRQGETFVKTWQLRNEGTCTWQDYNLVFAYGDIMNGPLASSISATPPGDTVDISLDLTAPTGGGLHIGNWQIESAEGKRFGVGITGKDFIWVRIIVNWIRDEQTTTSLLSNCQAVQDNAYEDQVLSLINQARSSDGLNPLTIQPLLSTAALTHSTDMACNDFVDHTGSDGSTWRTRVEAEGYIYSYVSENIYVGNPDFGGTPEGALDWWMNSQVHRDNILSPKVIEIGIGYVFNPDSTYGGYSPTVFATP